MSGRDTYFSDSENAPLVSVDLAVLRRVQHLQCLLEALRLQQELQIRLAAAPEEAYHFLVVRDGIHDLCFRQAAVAVRVDEREDLPGGVEELLLEGLKLAPVRGGLGLAGRAALLDLGLEGLLDRRFPAL